MVGRTAVWIIEFSALKNERARTSWTSYQEADDRAAPEALVRRKEASELFASLHPITSRFINMAECAFVAGQAEPAANTPRLLVNTWNVDQGRQSLVIARR